MRRPARPLLLVLVSLAAPCLGRTHTTEPGPDRHPGRPSELLQGQTVPLQEQSVPPQETLGGGWSQSELDRVSTDLCSRLEVLRGLSFKQDVRIVRVDPAIFELLAGRSARLEARHVQPLAAPSVAKLLGMARPDADLQADHEAAFAKGAVALYDHDEHACYVSEDAAFEDVPRALVAELARALDAQHFAAARPLEPNADAELARRAVAVGSALELVTRWLRSDAGPGREERESVFWQAFESIPLAALESLAPVVWRPAAVAYARGQAFLRGQGRPTVLGPPAPQGDVDTALVDPPRSAEQLLHPAKYWDPDRVDEPRRVTWSTSALDDGWRVGHENTLGEVGHALLTTPLDERRGRAASRPGLLGSTFTNRAAAGWGGDRYVLLERGGGALVCAASVWDTPRDAQEFHAALSALAPEIRASQASRSDFDAERSGFEVERMGAAHVLVTAWTGLAADEVSAALEALELSFE